VTEEGSAIKRAIVNLRRPKKGKRKEGADLYLISFIKGISVLPCVTRRGGGGGMPPDGSERGRRGRENLFTRHNIRGGGLTTPHVKIAEQRKSKRRG